MQFWTEPWIPKQYERQVIKMSYTVSGDESSKKKAWNILWSYAI